PNFDKFVTDVMERERERDRCEVHNKE
ncbi:MAG: hypothetical protein ACI8RD_012404, partial [Bacillariaceae sp.]